MPSSCTIPGMSNEIRFDFGNNPALANIFAGKNPGDTVKLGITIILKSQDSESATGKVKEVCDESEDESDDGEIGNGESKPNEAEPIAVVMMKGAAKGKE
jgi:hypothetical protein